MKSILNAAAAVIATFVGLTGTAWADGSLPEPGSIGLTGIALAVAVYVIARGRRK